MIDPLDLKALQEHRRAALSGSKPFHPTVYAATSQDKRVIDLVAFFNGLDERGRLTILRLAQVMPRGAL